MFKQRFLRAPLIAVLGLLAVLIVPAAAQAHTSAAEVSRILASYNLVSVPVVDENHRLVGVVTIDDVLDYLLPDDWRSTDSDSPEPVPTTTAAIPVRRRTPHGTR